jgi:NADPH:quinone reductase-like Zn-dependent oxidoreductase
VDVVLDIISGDTQERSWSTLKPNGTLISIIKPPLRVIATSYGMRQVTLDASPRIANNLCQVAELVDDGMLRPIVSAVFPLEEIQKAHQLLVTHHTRGKIVLKDCT